MKRRSRRQVTATVAGFIESHGSREQARRAVYFGLLDDAVKADRELMVSLHAEFDLPLPAVED